jgi:transcription antitermination factor NusG
MYFLGRDDSAEERLAAQTIPADCWQVLRVRSNFEKRVAQHLAARAVEHYLPLYRKRVKWSDRIVISERPLFPGYLFARYPAQYKVAVISTPGVVCSLGDETRDLVTPVELDRIREGLSKGCLLLPHPQISSGTKVRVRSGIFADVEGSVAEVRQQCKVVISVAATRQCFSLEVELSDLEIIDKLPIEANRRMDKSEGGNWRLGTANLRA